MTQFGKLGRTWYCKTLFFSPSRKKLFAIQNTTTGRKGSITDITVYQLGWIMYVIFPKYFHIIPDCVKSPCILSYHWCDTQVIPCHTVGVIRQAMYSYIHSPLYKGMLGHGVFWPNVLKIDIWLAFSIKPNSTCYLRLDIHFGCCLF